MKRCNFLSTGFCIILSGVSASLMIYNERKSWEDAIVACGQRKTIVTDFETNWIRPVTSCIKSDHFTFWSGRYITLSDWIAFVGCYNYIETDDASRMTSNDSTVAACYQWCISNGKFSFGLQLHSCICLENSTLAGYSNATGYHNCTRNGDEYYGIDTNIALYTFIAKPLKNMPDVMCSVYHCKDRSYHRALCNSTSARYICDNGITSLKPVNWTEALHACSNKGVYLQGTIPIDCRYNNTHYFWSYVKRFPHYGSSSHGEQRNLKVWKCEIMHLRNGSLSKEYTQKCQQQKLPYICQSDMDDGHISIHNTNRLCSLSVSTADIFKTTKATSSEISTKTIDVYKSDFVTSGLEAIKTTYQSLYHFTNETADQSTTYNTKEHMRIKSTAQSTDLAITHSVGQSTVENNESTVYIIVGVAVSCAVIIVVVIIAVIICRRKKENHKERSSSVSSSSRYKNWPTTSKSISSVPNQIYQQRESDLYADETVKYENTQIELYPMTNDTEYDHLHSNRRNLKQEVESLYDSTAHVRAEDGMYSSTTTDKRVIENNEFYDSMQSIRNDGQNIYDHTLSNCTNTDDVSDSMYSSTKYT